MKRYDMTVEYNRHGCFDEAVPVEDPTGKWVKFEDIAVPPGEVQFRMQSAAWEAVFDALEKEVPDWLEYGGSAEDNAVRAIRHLGNKATALDEWLEKTNWVQEQSITFPTSALGMHRADVMREEIERLRAALKSEHTLAVAAENEMRLMEQERDEARAALAEWEKLKDPAALHVNLLRGIPARLTKEQLVHIAGEAAYAELTAANGEQK